ncbi:four-carbon acid sugar kinase family protein [Alteribacillus sp. YIM 98480]|uniref:four-carbon acid sugar kinase family protein n=1 Tax=Alteribacillus sp. YIM 98480 TaxID=2606599 RepID=UPI00131BB981|nr:four-carbon acid sugar kinase family protein [Alteribacillus sp. YIM 98480]
MKNRLLLGFYGDDFTGSTDAMESLTINGFRTILFLETPKVETLQQFEDVQCVGIAGTSRAKTPEAMYEELQPVYKQLAEINPYYVHYKTCSTFDSSSEVGSIGYAADLAKEYFKDQLYYMLIAAPRLGRYTVFGQHFAKMNEEVYRLDHHPVMAKHPVTPMDEADLSLHLGKQTKQKIEGVNVLELEKGELYVSQLLNKFQNDNQEIIVFDALKESHTETFAKSIEITRNENPQFLIGSSGIGYALASQWYQKRLNKTSTEKKNVTKTDKVLVVSGSLSEITSDQMKHAIENGFHAEPIPFEYFGTRDIPHEFLEKIKILLETKKKVIIYTAAGSKDGLVEKTRKHLEGIGVSKKDMGSVIGRDLGKWTKKLVEDSQLQRVIISGGDTSGFVTKELDIYALELLTSISPGAPLCKAYSKNGLFDGIEIALKSGQLGGTNFYERVMS